MQDDKKTFSWIRDHSQKGAHLFTFDGVKVFNLFRDYPYNLTEEEKQIFDEANPYWVNFFKGRQ